MRDFKRGEAKKAIMESKWLLHLFTLGCV